MDEMHEDDKELFEMMREALKTVATRGEMSQDTIIMFVLFEQCLLLKDIRDMLIDIMVRSKQE